MYQVVYKDKESGKIKYGLTEFETLEKAEEFKHNWHVYGRDDKWEITRIEEIDKIDELENDKKELMNNLLHTDGYIEIKELAKRFIEVDEYFNHEPWNLLQILNNINIFIPITAGEIYDQLDNAWDD